MSVGYLQPLALLFRWEFLIDLKNVVIWEFYIWYLSRNWLLVVIVILSRVSPAPISLLFSDFVSCLLHLKAECSRFIVEHHGLWKAWWQWCPVMSRWGWSDDCRGKMACTTFFVCYFLSLSLLMQCLWKPAILYWSLIIIRTMLF